VTGFEPAAS